MTPPHAIQSNFHIYTFDLIQMQIHCIQLGNKKNIQEKETRTVDTHKKCLSPEFWWKTINLRMREHGEELRIERKAKFT